MKRLWLPLSLLLITCNAACAGQSAAQRLPTVQGAWVVVAPQEPTYWRGAEHKLYEYQQRIAQLLAKRNPVTDAQTLINRRQYYLLTSSRVGAGGIYGRGRGYGSVLPTAGIGISRVLQKCPAKILQGAIPIDVPSVESYGLRFNQTMVKACIKHFRLNEN